MSRYRSWMPIDVLRQDEIDMALFGRLYDRPGEPLAKYLPWPAPTAESLLPGYPEREITYEDIPVLPEIASDDLELYGIKHYRVAKPYFGHVGYKRDAWKGVPHE